MQTALFRFLTRVVKSTSYEDNRYTTNTSNCYLTTNLEGNMQLL